MTWSTCNEDDELGDVMLDDKLTMQTEDGMMVYSSRRSTEDEGEERPR